jgi:import inner membrane translocase subunit TIM44
MLFVGCLFVGHGDTNLMSVSFASIPPNIAPQDNPFSLTQHHHVSTKPPPPPEKRSFIGQLIRNIREDYERNREMKENLAKFRQEAQKLEEAEPLQKAREKFRRVESETTKGFDVVKEKISKTMEEAQHTEVFKKAGQVSEEIAKKAQAAAGKITDAADKMSEVEAFKTIGKGVEIVKKEVNIEDGMYKPPVKLRKRKETSALDEEMRNRTVPVNETATGIDLHQDSKWSQGWSSFRENNAYVNKIFDWKAKLDESDNPVARVTRIVSDKVSDVFGSMFSQNEMSVVLTEIIKMDPNFSKEQFLKDCENDIIPNVLEAMIRGDLDILQDWCHEGAYNVIATPIKQALAAGYRFDSKVLDLSNLDLAFAKMMDQGPVLVITFQTQQVLVVRNAKDEVVEGDPNQILRMNYVWVLCRDQNEVDPAAAWRVLEMGATSSNQFL